MIINTGMRTDIPAFYSKWLLNRIKEGFVYVRNPYYKNQVTKYSLSPEVVDCLAFCTKNPHPLIGHLTELDKYNQFWFVTITPYGKDIEPNVPDKKLVIEDFKKLSEHIGADSVALRYDPIFINQEFDVDKHIKCFERLLSQLKGYTHDCTISFLDLYEKVKRNAPDLRPPNEEEEIELVKAFAKIGQENDIVIHGCCEKKELKAYGIDITGCMSQEIVEKAIHHKLDIRKKQSQRAVCDCVLGNDIGAYNTCPHMCKYCYANANAGLVRENVKKHIPSSPFLIGKEEPGDKITEAKQISWIKEEDRQIRLI
ncbi:MAG: DUF1848 domain-containing protein [Clostridia bacterium]|nr:DUF1848 domain-containing protein [Clostridia bacterium]